MAVNSIQVSQLDQFDTTNGIARNDLLFISQKRGNGYESRKLTYGQLYDYIKQQIIADLRADWENADTYTSFADVQKDTAANRVAKVATGQVAYDVYNDLLAKIQAIDEYKAKWA